MRIATLLAFSLFISLSVTSQTLVDSLKGITQFDNASHQAKTYQTIGGKEGFKNLDSAIKYETLAETIALRLKDDTLLGKIYNDLSIAHFIAGNFDQTLAFGEKSLHHRLKTGDSLAIASAYSKLGMGHQELGNLKDATRYYGIASTIFVNNKEETKAAQIKNNMANILERNEQLDEAIKQASEASEILWNIKDTARYLVTKANHADLLRKNGNTQESIDIMNGLLPMAHNSFYPDFEGQLLQSIGLAYYAQQDTNTAEEYYKKAISIYRQHGSATGLVLMHGNLGTILLDKGNIEEAEAEFLAGLPYLEKSKSNIHKKLIYEGLYKINKLKNNYPLAFKYSELYNEAKDNIYSADQQKELLSLQKKFETEEKNRKIAEQDAKLVKQEAEANKKAVFYGVSTLLLCIFGLLLFWYLKQRKKNELIEKELKARQEKLRISRDLHDHIGAELTLIKSRIDQRAFLSSNEEEKKELEEISEYSKTAIDQLRKTIWATKNDKIDLDSFISNLSQYLNRFPIKHQIKQDHLNLELSSVVALNLFRACQETINNSVKYSKGDQLSILVSETKEKLVITLSDNGKGFDMQTVSKGYGLNNLEDRMKEINGEFQIQSNASGTTTLLTILNKT